jgi:predicted RNA-binding protein with PIN domain
MRYIIDACNVIFADNRLEETLTKRGFPAAREMLAGMLTKFACAEGLDEIYAVFDGSEKGAHLPRRQRESEGKVVLIYADPRADADRFIIEMVEDAPRPGEITVVSSDKFITRHVQRASAKHLGAREFLSKMRRSVRRAADPLRGEDPRKFSERGLGPREVAEWMDYFGFKDDE